MHAYPRPFMTVPTLLLNNLIHRGIQGIRKLSCLKSKAQNQKPENTKHWYACGSKIFYSLVMQMKNGTASLEDSLADSYKAKYSLTT